MPTGFNVKSVTPTHPNNGFGEFNKAVLKQIASSLGVSYAKLCKDYEAVNYSSLREGTLDEAAFYAELQEILIEQWKEIEFKLFIENLVMNTSILKPSQITEVLRNHTWICQRRPYFDPSKEILATERELKLGLKSPIMILEEEGKDPEEVLKSWVTYNDLCNKYGLQFNLSDDKKPLGPEDNNFDDEAAQTEMLESKRD